MPTTAETLTKILTEKFSVPEEKIRPEATLADLGLDSLDLIEVLFEVEDAFKISVPQDASAIRASTIQELLDTVTQLVETQSTAATGPAEPT
jgi:acyl carrier protein